MTQEEKDRLQYMIDVMQAYLDGKAIEINDETRAGWTLVDWIPSWNWNECDYRIKPEPPKPKYRPFENAEEVMEAIKEHGLCITSNTGNTIVIIEFNDAYVWCGADSRPQLLRYYFEKGCGFSVDGTPFGKLIEE